MSKINKALDLNKLFEDQKKGKLLKKHIRFPIFGSIKYDGNYTVVIKDAQGLVKYITSGGHLYNNGKPTIFDDNHVKVGVYIAERIHGKGLLGDRKNCSLRGSRGMQTSHGHTYKVHDYLTLEEYEDGITGRTYYVRKMELLVHSGLQLDDIVDVCELLNQDEVDDYLKEVVNQGYEGIMLKNSYWIWRDTKSRTVDNVKYKKRRTADLLCFGWTRGTGKYEGMIGSLKLKDSQNRIVDVGSGLDDVDRLFNPSHFINEVIEIEYEQIMDTYIQPSFVRIRPDKEAHDID